MRLSARSTIPTSRISEVNPSSKSRTNRRTFNKSHSTATPKMSYTWNDGTTTPSSVWPKVDEYTTSHLHPPNHPNAEILAQVQQNSEKKGLPDIATWPVQAKFFALQCRALGVKHALEVGTLGGYTPIFLATENPGLRVSSVEVDGHHAKVAEENVRAAGVEDRVDVRLGAGLDVLPRLAEEINAGKKERLGFAYIDADKENNWDYLNLIIDMCHSGAVVYVDNIVRGGDLVNSRMARDPGVKGARKVIEMAGKDERVDGVVMQMVGEKGYDGVLMVVVK